MSSKSKKPKKKYKPRAVYYPGIINFQNSFKPFEDALNRILVTGEGNVDENNCLYYVDQGGVKHTFIGTLNIYLQLLEFYTKEKEIKFNLDPLYRLQNRIFEAILFDEEEIEGISEAVDLARRIVSFIGGTEMTSIMNVIRKNIANALNEINPEAELNKFGYQSSFLTHNQLVDKVAKFKKLKEEYPEHPRYIILHEWYTKYLNTFLNQQKRN